MAEAVPKNVCSQKQVFGQTILEQPLPLEFLAGIPLQSSISYIEFRLFPTKL
ncbi:hypothetical protein CNEO3_460027 [Clostridium neonatale]|nr:hypothetical protein CNEO3_460027 [Clostridium neonatale]